MKVVGICRYSGKLGSLYYMLCTPGGELDLVSGDHWAFSHPLWYKAGITKWRPAGHMRPAALCHSDRFGTAM